MIMLDEASVQGGSVPWSRVSEVYRRVLFDIGQEVPNCSGGARQRGFSDSEVADVRGRCPVSR